MSINLDRIVNATVTRATRTASRRSFGSILIAAYHTAWLDRVRTYTDPADMLTDGFTEDHPAYKAALAAASQSPRLPRFKIGRRAGAPTQTLQFTPVSVEEGYVYTQTIRGETASYTAQAGDGATEVAAGMVAAVNGLTVAVTATDNLDGTYDVAADAAGDWFDHTDIASRLELEDITAEPATTLATDLGAIQDEDANFFSLVVADAQSAAQISAVAAWAETQVVHYVAHTVDDAVKKAGSTDIHSTLKASEYFRTTPFFGKTVHGSFPDAALLSRFLTYTVGSADVEFKGLTGITPEPLTTTEVERILGTPEDPGSGKRGIVYVEAVPTGTNSGTAITKGGLTAGGEWLDVMMGLDFTKALAQERAFNLRLGEPKLPFTTSGIDALAGAVRGAARTAASPPHNILDPESVLVESTALEDVSDADRQARYYDGVRLSARVQGAMRAFRVRITVRP